jgi:hypothetical protein
LSIVAAQPPRQTAESVREAIPDDGLFAGQTWRIATRPFELSPRLAKELESLGRVLLQFYRSVDLLYRHSAEGKQPGWVAEWLDRGKPDELIALQRAPALKNELPRVIRPDLLLTDDGLSITELDSVPGGIGLTGWLNQTYSDNSFEVLGGREGITKGFASIFGKAERVHIVVSEESASYIPEMQWLAAQRGNERFSVRDGSFMDFQDGDAVYRFFELFDTANVPAAGRLFEMAQAAKLRLTPPPRPIFEEKILFALLWNRNLESFWHQQLGGAFLRRMKRLTPYSWIIDPTPLPPMAAIPELNLTDWQQLKTLSQRERDLILKISGYSPSAWGARGVYLGSDLSKEDWSAAVDEAIGAAGSSPYVLQRFHKPTAVKAHWFDFASSREVEMDGRVRLCPYYFVSGEGDAARANLGGVLATVCPPDKKIIHGMPEAVMAPCSLELAAE